MQYNFDEEINRENTNSLKWDRGFLQKQYGDAELLPLWVADMDFKAPQPVIDALVERAEHGIFGYNVIKDDYYKAIVDWNKKRHDWEVEKDWICFVPGIVPAMNYLVQAFCRPGDKVIIQDPVYYPFYSAVKNNGCHVVKNTLKMIDGKYRMDIGDLEQKAKDLRVKLIFLCSPHNPVGRVWTEKELIALGEICMKNNVLVVSDEIHSDLILKGFKHTPFASISERFAQNSIICTAPSKTFNLAGLQTANLVIQNDRLRSKVEKLLKKNFISEPNGFGVVACQTAYQQGEEWLEQLLEYLEENLNYIDRFIKEKMPQVKLIRPEGTYLAWLDFREIETDHKKLEEKIQRKAKILLDEGYIFGETGAGFERINFACPRALLKNALERIAKVFNI